MDTPNPAQTSPEIEEQLTLSRRQLLKALLAAGGAASLAMLPARWKAPMVEVGVLPAHAQISPTVTPGPSVTPTPTRVQLAINSLTFMNPDTDTAFFHPGDTIRTFAYLSPPAADVPLRATLYLRQSSHPQNGELATGVRLTGNDGRSYFFDYDLSIIVPPIDPGTSRLEIVWGFENPGDGLNTLSGSVDILPESQTL